jgi:hypothetical protein
VNKTAVRKEGTVFIEIEEGKEEQKRVGRVAIYLLPTLADVYAPQGVRLNYMLKKFPCGKKIADGEDSSPSY